MEKIPFTNKFSAAEKFILKKLKKELSPDLSYHGLHHTLDVLNAALEIAEVEKIPAKETRLLRIAVLYHDAGFINTYKNHEEKGCEMAKENLPLFDFNEEEIEVICKMIMATKIPQSPLTKLEKIICDADLDYLGRNDFYSIGKTLFNESKIYANIKTEKEWDIIQKDFLEKHHYHTQFSRKHRDPQKKKYLKEIKQCLQDEV